MIQANNEILVFRELCFNMTGGNPYVPTGGGWNINQIDMQIQMQYIEQQRIEAKMENLLSKIKLIRKNIAGEFKIQAEAFIKFLNLEAAAENSTETDCYLGRCGDTLSSEVCERQGAYGTFDYSCSFSVSPGSLSANNSLW